MPLLAIPCQAHYLTCLLFWFDLYCMFQAWSVDVYTSFGRTGKPLGWWVRVCHLYPVKRLLFSIGVWTTFGLRSSLLILLSDSSTFPRDGAADRLPPVQMGHWVDSAASPGVLQQDFLASKKLGSWRLVFDLGALNRHLHTPQFKMETTASIMCSLQAGHWVTSLDFKDAFLHIPITPAHWCYLGFWFRHCYFQFQALPSSLAMSPYLFTHLVKAVGKLARLQGLSLSTTWMTGTSWLHRNLLRSLDHLAPQSLWAAWSSHQPSQVQPSAIQTFWLCGHWLWSQWLSSQCRTCLLFRTSLQTGLLQLSDDNNSSATWLHLRNWLNGAVSTCIPYSSLSTTTETSCQIIPSYQSSCCQIYFQWWMSFPHLVQGVPLCPPSLSFKSSLTGQPRAGGGMFVWLLTRF